MAGGAAERLLRRDSSIRPIAVLRGTEPGRLPQVPACGRLGLPGREGVEDGAADVVLGLGSAQGSA